MGIMNWLVRICGLGTGVGVLALALLYLFQEKLLYVPKIPGVPADYWIEPDRYGLKYEDIEITTADNVKLHAWLLTTPSWTSDFVRSRPVVVFFQENAGNMAFRLPFLKLVISELRCPVLALSYRGYGRSQGAPSERGLKLDSEAALSYLALRPELDSKRVVIFGRSLGGAVAIHLTAKFPEKVKALVLENAFASVEDMVKRVVPPLGYLIGAGRPMNWLVTNKWYNLRVIKDIKTVPILMMVSMQDEMVPPDQMHQLYAAAKTAAAHVALVEFPLAQHMDAYETAAEQYWPALCSFVDKYA